MKPGSISATSGPACRCSRCDRWPAVRRSHRAYLHATQQAFLEAHEHAFAFFGGVFQLLRYDNLASAVRKILRGYRQEETVRFMAFRSTGGLPRSSYTPGEGHEKVALKAKVVTSGATIWFRCRVSPISLR